jgi:hypothetical protein
MCTADLNLRVRSSQRFASRITAMFGHGCGISGPEVVRKSPIARDQRSIAAIGTVIFSLIQICTAQGRQAHFSTLQGTTVRMQPFGYSFQIPYDWTLKYGGVVLTRPELEKAKKGKEEWYKEYATIVNAALPFGECSVQAGNQRWDSGAESLQMRGYVIESSAEEVEKGISTQGFAAAKSLPSKVAKDGAIRRDNVGQWRRILITSDLWYGDYGGKANVDFYVNTHDGETVVLVFMYAIEGRYTSTVQQILRSFSWQ